MHGYKITKYDPASYGEGGIYLRDEWTSVSDIGKTFDETPLTEAEYQKVEDSYLEAIRLFADAVQVHRLQVRGLEINDDSLPCNLEEGQHLDISSAIEVCRKMLREAPIWCRLESNRDFYVHIGYDYYMYIGVNADVRETVRSVQRLGLFVEDEWVSPYLDD